MSDYKKCVNCGKQNIIDEHYKPEDKCEFGNHPVGIKVEKQEELAASSQEPPQTSQETSLTSQETPQSEEPAPIYEGKSHRYPRGIRKWGKICKECLSYYLHDEIAWCSSKKCPKHCPPALRPQYRPKESSTSGDERKKVVKAFIALKKVPQDVDEAEDVCPNCPVLQAYKGYRLGVKETLGAIKRV